MSDILPLDGYKFIELAGIGPAPYAGRILTDLGAQILRIEKQGGINLPEENKNKTTIKLDLKNSNDREKIYSLLPDYHGVFEGARPGVMENIGLGPNDCHNINPKLIYGRVTGWGQTGPWAKKAGHDINFIALSGALYAMGEADRPPAPPLNLVGDYGAGSQFLVIGILAALLEAQKSGQGRVLDIAIIDGTISMLGITRSLAELGMWSDERGTNLLDGSRPYYRCYKTKDAGFMAVGCVEEKFFLEMLNLLQIDPKTFGAQNNPDKWPEQVKILSDIFISQPQKYWEELFDNSDACVTPVLSQKQAQNHKQVKSRYTDRVIKFY